MKKIRREVLKLTNDLKKLLDRADGILKELDSIQGVTSKGALTAKKPERRGAIAEKVYAVIKRSKTPVDLKKLVKKTDLEQRSIRDALYRLKRKGLIKVVAKGQYTKV